AGALGERCIGVARRRPRRRNTGPEAGTPIRRHAKPFHRAAHITLEVVLPLRRQIYADLDRWQRREAERHGIGRDLEIRGLAPGLPSVLKAVVESVEEAPP